MKPIVTLLTCLPLTLSLCTVYELTSEYCNFTDEAVFQLQMGPITPCSTWTVSIPLFPLMEWKVL